MSLTIPLQPVPAARPRVTKWGCHYPKTYAQWKRQAQLYLPQNEPLFPDKRQHLVVITEFIVKPARTTKLTTPRGDLDNYTKAAWDAVTKAGCAWHDDDQVILGIEHKRFTTDEEEPRTELLIVPI